MIHGITRAAYLVAGDWPEARLLIRLCRDRGCGEMFVLTDEANEAAMATYRTAGARREPDQVMFYWPWSVRES